MSAGFMFPMKLAISSSTQGIPAFPQEIRALTDYSVLRRRIGRKLADALWRSVGAVFDGLTDGCSQRYPHLGYAQNPLGLRQSGVSSLWIEMGISASERLLIPVCATASVQRKARMP